jgi:hypothetical protein
MKLNVKVGTLAAAAGALAIAVPAAAHPGPGNHPSKPDHPSTSHKCMAHNVAYVESGTIDATTLSTLAKNSDGTWTGTLAVDVTRTNHAARKDNGTIVTPMFTNATLHVNFADTATGFTSGERVKLIGKLATVAKKCPPPSTPATPVFRMIVVHPVKS